MAETVTFNNAIYIIPDVGESNWGQNLTNYFVAIASGSYQLSGGTNPLTADLSFGSNFGLLGLYFKSVSSNIATAGVVRLANTDLVEWRNNANSGNDILSVDSSDNLKWNGNIIAGGSAGPVTSLAGTANEITASAATGAVTLSIPSAFVAPGSIAATTTLAGTSGTLSATTNQLVMGTTKTVTFSSTAPSTSRTYTIPDVGANANVVLDAGNYTIAGTWSFSNSITLASSKAVILTDNSTNTVTIQATNSTTSWTMKLPTTKGTSNYFLQTDGNGNTTWAAGGSGTISSGTTNGVGYYTAGTTIGSTAVGTTGQLLMGTTGSPPSWVTTLSGIYTFSGGAGAITMSGSTIAMGSNKITGLANGTAATDAAAFGQFSNLLSYRRPRIIYGSSTTVSIETGNNGTANQAAVLFPDGSLITDSTAGHITMTISQNASYGASPQGGLDTGTVANNTWYACYAVKANSGAALVCVASLNLPIQANYATLNTNFGTNGWVYLGLIRNGDNESNPSGILKFAQAGNTTNFSNVVTIGPSTQRGLEMAYNGSGVASWAYAAGTGSLQVPNNISILRWCSFLSSPSGSSTYSVTNYAGGYNVVSVYGLTGIVTLWPPYELPATEGMYNSIGAANGASITGFIDNVLGVGPNPLF